MKNILVAGGAGYIGSHMVALLLQEGYNPVVVDNLSTGHRAAVGDAPLLVGDLGDATFLEDVFCKFAIDGVINFAAFSLVGESVFDPLKYYQNNLSGSMCLLESMRKHGVDKIVFSSTAATYGEPEKQPIEEGDKTCPTNPYGATKLAIEGLLHWCEQAYGIGYVALRYFNAAGASPTLNIGEDHTPETHLIPLVMNTALKKREFIGIFGDDYPTPDRSCVRDYVHVDDLAQAHLLALGHLAGGGRSGVFNLGSGGGYSVKEIVQMARKVTGCEIPTKTEPRRAGDPSMLVASTQSAGQVLGWQPTKNLEQIIADAWRWHSNNPNGYTD